MLLERSLKALQAREDRRPPAEDTMGLTSGRAMQALTGRPLRSWWGCRWGAAGASCSRSLWGRCWSDRPPSALEEELQAEEDKNERWSRGMNGLMTDPPGSACSSQRSAWSTTLANVLLISYFGVFFKLLER